MTLPLDFGSRWVIIVDHYGQRSALEQHCEGMYM